MMKKKFKFLVIMLALVLALPLGIWTMGKNTAFAENSAAENAKYEQFASETRGLIEDYSRFDSRVAGTTDEVEGKTEASAAEYIRLQLLSTALTPKNNTHVKEGVQTFQFLSNFTGLYQTSHNIVFEYKVNDSPNKIVLGTSYDAFAVKETEESMEVVGVEGINDSAGSVALMLYLARHIQELDIGINVEFAFFGAGGCNNAGSKFYVQGIDLEEQKNILCMINLEDIAIGKNLYFYVGEFDNKLSDFMTSLNSQNAIGIKKIDLVHLNKMEQSPEESLGLGYTHLAMASNNFNFMKLGITAMNIFAGDYESGIEVGRSEYSYLESITYTENDNLTYINNHYDEDIIYKNLFKVYDGLAVTMTNGEFVGVLAASAGQNAIYYDIFANPTLAVLLTAIAFGIMICVAIFIYFHLTKKSYYSNVEMEFLSTVVKITDQIGEKDGDFEVTKIVSQTIANDIRKSKTIKSKKKPKE